MVGKALFSSDSVLWGTPPEVFRLLNDVYDFQLDAASNQQNHLCPQYFTREENGLLLDWSQFKRVWLNPPYGRQIGRWMQKAFEESQKGCLVVCLVPARVDTKWWHDWVQDKGRVTFFKGRLRFVKHMDRSVSRAGSAPFPSALVTYEPDLALRARYSRSRDEHGRTNQRADKIGSGL